MKKYGKYEKRPEGVPEKQPKVKSALLQTYFTSLICMVLCVTMFFGTSYAWFTSEVTNEGNEIYIGILDVDLQDKDDKSLVGNTNPLFTDSIHWEPGYTALETVKVVDEGDLAFRYELTLKEDANSQLGGMALNDVAKWFDVWCYHDANNAVPTPENYGQITEAKGWTKVGSLDEVLAGKVVFRGSMTEAEVTADTAVAHTYTIALHMNGEEVAENEQTAFNTLMGKSIGLNVKLVATQLSSEDDGFGNADYDKQETATEVTPENLGTIDFSANQEATYVLGGTFAGTYTINLPAGANITIDGSGATFSEGAVLVINAPRDADNYSVAQGKERVGSYTIQNFNGEGALNFVGYNTTVNVTNNTLGFLGLRLANVTANVTGNKIDGQSVAHKKWDGNENKYGVYLEAADYALTFSNNTVVNTNSNAVGINGRKDNPDWPGDGSNASVVAQNSIIFTGNTISGYGSGKAALKIWNDTYYAANPLTNEMELSDHAKTLINHVLAAESQNTITAPSDSYKFDIYNLSLNQLSS